MKSLLLNLLILSFAVTANADLQQIMKSMGRDFKLIAAQVSDSTKNQSTLSATQDLEKLIPQALNEVPDTVAELTGEEHDAKLAEYKKQIGDLLTLAQTLEQALVENDNIKATQIAQQMNDVKKNGHDEFKKQD